MSPSVLKWIDCSLTTACTAADFFVTLKTRELVLTASASVIGAKLITNPITDTLHSVSGLEIFAVNLTLLCQSDPAFTGKFKVDASSATSTATK
jgi:hypothetical protein